MKKWIRFSITVTPEMEQDLDELRKDEFKDKDQSEMLRYLIRLGLESANEKENKTPAE